MSFGEQLERRLTPWNTPSLEVLVGAINAMIEPLAEVLEGASGIVAPTFPLTFPVTFGESKEEPAWGAILNPNTFPNTEGSNAYPFRFNPQYLAQFVGVTLLTQFTHAQAMAYIRSEPGFSRGTLGAVEAAATRVLGATPFKVLERANPNSESDAYWFLVVTSPLATTVKSELEVALNEVKPGGVLYELVEVQNAWIEGTKEWGEVGAATWESVIEGEY